MVGVKFGKYHSYDDFSLIYNPGTEIEPAEVKDEGQEVPGSNLYLDYTEAFGKPKYKRRSLSFPFTYVASSSADFWRQFTKVQNAIQGKKVKIIMDTDPDYYYIGRVSMSKWKADKRIGEFTVDCICNPYKLKIYKTVRTEEVAGAKTVVFVNDNMDVVPTFITDTPMTIEFNGGKFNLNPGASKSSGIIFKEGNNYMKISGNGTLRVEYQEGSL